MPCVVTQPERVHDALGALVPGRHVVGQIHLPAGRDGLRQVAASCAWDAPRSPEVHVDLAGGGGTASAAAPRAWPGPGPPPGDDVRVCPSRSVRSATMSAEASGAVSRSGRAR